MEGTIAMVVRMLLMMMAMAIVPAAANGSCTRMPCCMPDQWQRRQGVTYIVTGNLGTYITQTNSDVTYDAINEREAYTVKRVSSQGSAENFKFFAFYKKQIGFKYDLDTKTCNAVLLQAFRKRCVPDNYTVLDSELTLGSEFNQLTAARVAFQFQNNAGSPVKSRLVLSTRGCVPILEEQTTESLGNFMMSRYVFENMEEGIESEDVFALPAACQGVVSTKRSEPMTAEGILTMGDLPA